jgi:hypothetical protein
MTDESAPRFSLWFRAWWLALLGAVVAVGGGVVWLVTRVATAAASFGWYAYQPLAPRITDDGSSWAFAAAGPFSVLNAVVHVAGAVLFIAGLVTVAAAVGYRLGRARP